MDDGRRERFIALYHWARPRVLSYVVRRTRSPEDAADAVAETFAITWRRLDDVPAGDEALLWLYVTARGVLANEWRRTMRRSEVLARVAAALTETEHPARDEDRLIALSCLDAMTAEDRELFMLAAWEGLDASQLGRVLGCSTTSARVRLHRARRRLEATLARIESPAPVSTVRAEHSGPRSRCGSEEA